MAHTPTEVLRRAGHRYPEQIIGELRSAGYYPVEIDADVAPIIRALAKDASDNGMRQTYAFLQDLLARITTACTES